MFSIKDCGLMIEPQQGMRMSEVVAWAQFAESAGFGYFFRSDHILSIYNAGEVDSPECWVTLAAVAAKTERIVFGGMVSPVGFRNPALLARMACTLDSYSSGRVRLCLGAGWYEPEYTAHGIPFPKFAVRREQLVEALQIIKPMISGERVDYDGKYFSAHVECLPKPSKGKIPLILGGRSAKVLEAGAEYADEINIFNTPIDNLTKLKGIVEAKKKGVAVSLMSSFVLGETRHEVDTRLRNYMKARGLKEADPQSAQAYLEKKGILCGTVEEFVSQLNQRRELGVKSFYFQILDPRERSMADTLVKTLKKF